MVLFYQGKTDAARQLLEEAVKVQPVDPRYFFHLALIERRLGKMDDAHECLSKAKTGGLTPDGLTPTEKTSLSELEQSLAPPAVVPGVTPVSRPEP